MISALNFIAIICTSLEVTNQNKLKIVKLNIENHVVLESAEEQISPIQE
jgi:hypothetical protein